MGVLTTLNFDAIAEANGFSIAIMGMLIVFCALGLISLFIGWLPQLVALGEPWLPDLDTHASSPSLEESLPVDNERIIAAIGLALRERHQHH